MKDLARCCHNCQFRHSTCGKTEDEHLATYETHKCDDFVIGKCYVCAVYQAMSEEELWECRVCDEAFYPDGCDSFKPGDGYEEWLKLYREVMLIDLRIRGTCIEFPRKKQISSLVRKRRAIAYEREKLKKLCRSGFRPCGSYPIGRDGYWCEEDGEDFVRYKRVYRGQRSKWIKKKCNRRLRRSQKCKMEGSRARGFYRKMSEFWWDYW